MALRLDNIIEFPMSALKVIMARRRYLMAINRLILMGAVLFSSGSVAFGAEAGPTVVSVHYSVRENDPDKLEKLVAIPVEQRMQRLDGVARISSSTSHGVVDVEVGFQGDATIHDLKAVVAQIEALKFAEDVVVMSRAIALRPAVFQLNRESN